MTGPRRAVSLALLFAVFACQGEPDESTVTAVPTSSSTAETTSATGSTMTTTTTTMTTGATEAPTTAMTTGATTPADGCSSYAAGDWNQCQVDGVNDNSKCKWVEGSGAGMPLCLSPTSGGFNVCGIRDCVDVCDCFAPPATGTAVPACLPKLGGMANGCLLYCAGGQICPDGMMCESGTCYWPD